MKLRYTPTAFVQLQEIAAYIGAHNPYGATRVQARIKHMIDLLIDFPKIGTPTDDPVIRRIATPPYPYVVYYELTADEIIIHAVRHGARDPGSAPGRA
ncbi:MAG TPA: type II toxin-antitoxin system RelE/ParE family toxin [Vineibacter sp.]|nr:type II toxin-antitoxin system RelE/ParE family toxin [Vineibacter sp.]